MKKIKRILCAIIFLVVFCGIVSIFIPELAPAFDLILHIEWFIIKFFFFEDWIKTIIIWVFISSLLYGGFYMSKRKKTKLWILSAIVVDVIGYIFMFIGK